MSRPKVVGLSANVQRPSKTRTLVDAVLHEVSGRSAIDGRIYDFVDAGTGLGSAWTRDQLSLPARRIVQAVEEADALIVGSPVYKGSYTGLFKHLFDLLDPSALAGKPVAIVATGGGARHALVVEHAFRPLLGFFGALQVPVAVYASDADFADGTLTDQGVRERLGLAGSLLAGLVARTAAEDPPIPVAAAR